MGNTERAISVAAGALLGPATAGVVALSTQVPGTEHVDKLAGTPLLLVQVNVGDEPQKAGIPTAEADGFIDACRRRFGEAVRGLMCIPPADGDPAPHFRWLAACAGRHGLSMLSMGMSADFETAIQHGATHVRVGSAIFGVRT